MFVCMGSGPWFHHKVKGYSILKLNWLLKHCWGQNGFVSFTVSLSLSLYSSIEIVLAGALEAGGSCGFFVCVQVKFRGLSIFSVLWARRLLLQLACLLALGQQTVMADLPSGTQEVCPLPSHALLLGWPAAAAGLSYPTPHTHTHTHTQYTHTEGNNSQTSDIFMFLSDQRTIWSAIMSEQ